MRLPTVGSVWRSRLTGVGRRITGTDKEQERIHFVILGEDGEPKLFPRIEDPPEIRHAWNTFGEWTAMGGYLRSEK